MRRSYLLPLVVVSVVFAQGLGHAAEREQKKAATPAKKARSTAMAEITDDPALPRVLLIGDSISIGYTLPVRAALAGKANVHRPAANCGPTIRGQEDLDKWLGKGKWDVIHFNWGLHDLRIDNGAPQVPIDQYEKNLTELVGRLKKTGARLIWCSTTPVPDGTGNRNKGDELKYNAVAQKIMDANGIPSDDLYGFALPQLAKIQLPANVHFTPEGYKALADQVTAAIVKTLAKPK